MAFNDASLTHKQQKNSSVPRANIAAIISSETRNARNFRVRHVRSDTKTFFFIFANTRLVVIAWKVYYQSCVDARFPRGNTGLLCNTKESSGFKMIYFTKISPFPPHFANRVHAVMWMFETNFVNAHFKLERFSFSCIIQYYIFVTLGEIYSFKTR